MVNTRILEQRLGWRKDPGDSDGSDTPPARPLGHSPLLQGRVHAVARSGTQRPRRAETEALWDTLPILAETPEHLGARGGRAPAFGRGTVVGAAMDQLRTPLLRVCQTEGWRRIGVTSPDRGAGRSFVTAALAASLARLNAPRVLCVDADLEAPGLHEPLGLTPQGTLAEMFEGAEPAACLGRVGGALAVALNDTPIVGAGDLMHQPDAILAWRELIDLVGADLILLDMPPLLDDPVAQALLPQVDAVLMISDGLATKAADILECERLIEGQVPQVGVILNKSEDRDTRPRGRKRR